ncbi:MobF family relaxase [Actinomyces sp.]|uniref:MobF family relaxase n=1 Tax=Actinomyces sp. TaxID=29317 RepID=UPI0026DBA1F6|nr:MobF family relaxase [Actinomyces sp.]MDO4900840.1 MobF family relaxase [Actinomyces sp.]
MRQLYDRGRPGQSIVDYLVDSVADGPGAQPAAAYGSSRYYTDGGTPPGRWVGTGIAGLGDDPTENNPMPAKLKPGDIVSAEQLRALVEKGRDPLTEKPLGRAFPKHLTAQERADILRRELPKNLTEQEREARERQIDRSTSKAAAARAVHAFDHTFAPPKSVSVLWALGDQGIREQVEAAHHEAIAKTVQVMEADTIRTRIGAGGVSQELTKGMVAAAFDHWDSRAGDPHLHTHLVIANRVQAAEDGKWRTLDSNGALFPSIVALSEAYDNYLMDSLSARLGVSFSARTLSRTGRAQYQIDGISNELIEEFSQRHAAIDAARDQEDGDASGHWDADRKAWADTRMAKEHRPLSQLTEDWRRRAVEVAGPDPLRGVVGRPRQVPGTPAGWPGMLPPAARSGDVTDQRIEEMADHVVAVLQSSRPSWSDWNIRAEAERTLRSIRCATAADRDALRARLCEAATAKCVRIDRVDRAHTPARWRRPDGTSRFEREHSALWVTQDLLDAEDYLLRASQAAGAPAIADARQAVAAWRSQDGKQLLPDQAAAVAKVLSSTHPVDVLIGPAGSGKTTAMAALADTWQAHYGQVVGLAPSAAAADVLGQSLGIETANTAQWLVAQQHGTAPLRAGQLVIVDEASMAATLPLAEIVSRASSAGARVLLVGDPDQLGAVQAGGAFGMITRHHHDPATLTTVHRFADAWQAQASLLLRAGDASVLRAYNEHDCVTSGEREEVIEGVYRAWRDDVDAGVDSIMIAADNNTVSELNERARADLKAAGKVGGREVVLHDKTHASAGDRIVTRRNAHHLGVGNHKVHNGAAWDVVAARTDGSLLVTPADDPTAAAISLPAAYVAADVELGYATTVHRSQGRTVDRAHAIVDSTLTRQGLYVAMSRARGANLAHVVVDDPQPDTADIHDVGSSTPTDALAVMAEILRRDGADRTARESAADLNERTNTVRQLANEYDTITSGDGGHVREDRRWDQRLPRLIPQAQHEQLRKDPHYEALLELMQARDGGQFDLRDLVPAILAEAPLDPDRPVQDLADRIIANTPMSEETGGGTYIAGLIQPGWARTPDAQRALDERADRINARAAHVLATALRERQPWTRSLGTPPTDPRRRAAWLQAATAVAAYRDLYGITDGTLDDSPHMDPLGVRPISGEQETKFQTNRRQIAAWRLAEARRIADEAARPETAPAPTPDQRPEM